MIHQIFSFIAQTASPAASAAGNAQQGTNNPGGGQTLFIGFIVMLAVFYFVLIRGNRKQQAQKQSLLDNLSKNDKVMTIGGIIGSVVSVRDNEVVLRVDESNNTKMTFLKKSIQQVITDGYSGRNKVSFVTLAQQS